MDFASCTALANQHGTEECGWESGMDWLTEAGDLEETSCSIQITSRKILNEDQAAQIYLQKLMIIQKSVESNRYHGINPLRGYSLPIASLYNISAKTVRDIWNRLIWQNATRHLWAEEDSSTLEPNSEADPLASAFHQVSFSLNIKMSQIL